VGAAVPTSFDTEDLIYTVTNERGLTRKVRKEVEPAARATVSAIGPAEMILDLAPAWVAATGRLIEAMNGVLRGAICLTDTRLVFVDSHGGRFEAPLAAIRAVRSKALANQTWMTLRIAGSGEMQFGIMGKRGSDRLFFQGVSDAVQRAHETARAAATTPTPSTGGGAIGIADELEKLASLRDRGILSDEEFDVRKSALLS
jgi:hypothetical protein